MSALRQRAEEYLKMRQLACAGGERRPKTGPSPVDRARPGSKHHVITEAHGIPLAVSLTGGNRNDVTQLMPLIEAIPPVRCTPLSPRPAANSAAIAACAGSASRPTTRPPGATRSASMSRMPRGPHPRSITACPGRRPTRSSRSRLSAASSSA